MKTHKEELLDSIRNSSLVTKTAGLGRMDQIFICDGFLDNIIFLWECLISQ